MKRVAWLDTNGGHIIVALFIFAVGVGMSLFGKDMGDKIIFGALASLWTALRSRGKDGDDGSATN